MDPNGDPTNRTYHNPGDYPFDIMCDAAGHLIERRRIPFNRNDPSTLLFPEYWQKALSNDGPDYVFCAIIGRDTEEQYAVLYEGELRRADHILTPEEIRNNHVLLRSKKAESGEHRLASVYASGEIRGAGADAGSLATALIESGIAMDQAVEVEAVHPNIHHPADHDDAYQTLFTLPS